LIAALSTSFSSSRAKAVDARMRGTYDLVAPQSETNDEIVSYCSSSQSMDAGSPFSSTAAAARARGRLSKPAPK